MSGYYNASLLAPSMIRVVGRVLATVQEVNPPAKADAKAKAAYQGRSHLAQALQRDDLRLAHVFGFTHAGRYTPLHTPALFLVHGEGEPMQVDQNGRIDPALLGLPQLDTETSFAHDLRVWTYDRNDESLRLDISFGRLEQLLVEAETGHGRRIDLVGQDGSYAQRLGGGS